MRIGRFCPSYTATFETFSFTVAWPIVMGYNYDMWSLK